MSIIRNNAYVIAGVVLSLALVFLQNADAEEVFGSIIGALQGNSVERISASVDNNGGRKAASATTNRQTSGFPEDQICAADALDGSLIVISYGSYFGTNFSFHGYWEIPPELPDCNGYSFHPLHGTAVLAENLVNISAGFSLTCIDTNWDGAHYHFDVSLVTGVGIGFWVNNATGAKGSATMVLVDCP